MPTSRERPRLVEVDLPQPLAEAHAEVGADAPRPSVGDGAARVDGAEVATSGHVPALQLEVDAERLEDSASHREAEGIVAEEAQVAGPAAGGDAGADVPQQATGRAPGEGVQRRDVGGLELALAGARLRQAAQAVEGAEDVLAGR